MFLKHVFLLTLSPLFSRVHATTQIWTVSKDWEAAWDGWKTGLFTDLDVEEMESAAGTFTKKVCAFHIHDLCFFTHEKIGQIEKPNTKSNRGLVYFPLRDGKREHRDKPKKGGENKTERGIAIVRQLSLIHI